MTKGCGNGVKYGKESQKANSSKNAKGSLVCEESYHRFQFRIIVRHDIFGLYNLGGGKELLGMT